MLQSSWDTVNPKAQGQSGWQLGPVGTRNVSPSVRTPRLCCAFSVRNIPEHKLIVTSLPQFCPDLLFARMRHTEGRGSQE